MSQFGSRDNPLRWDVFVTPSIPMVIPNLAPGQKQMVWQPISSTLVYGKRDAVLVDSFVTIEQNNALIDWITSRGKNLTTIYATHGHGDHWFGIGALLNRFPEARAVATPDVVKVMRRSLESGAKNWKSMFPGQISDRLVVAEELEGKSIDLEGRDLVAVEVGHGDSDHSTCLHVPSADLVVAGDVAYNDCHQYFVESNKSKRGEWISALDKIESLNPRAVVAGHKRPGREDSPRIIEETRQYIRDFDRLDGIATTALELYTQMLKIYPDRINPGMLWTSALSAKGGVAFQ